MNLMHAEIIQGETPKCFFAHDLLQDFFIEISCSPKFPFPSNPRPNPAIRISFDCENNATEDFSSPTANCFQPEPVTPSPQLQNAGVISSGQAVHPSSIKHLIAGIWGFKETPKCRLKCFNEIWGGEMKTHKVLA